jgi:hypothetical protein
LGRLEIEVMKLALMVSAIASTVVAAGSGSWLFASEPDQGSSLMLLANTINLAVAAQRDDEGSRHSLQKAWDLMLAYRIRFQEWPDRVEPVAYALRNLHGSPWRCETHDDLWVPALCGLLLNDSRTTLSVVEQLASQPKGGFCGNAMAAEDFAFRELEAWAHLRLGDYDSALKAVAAAEKDQPLANIDVGSQRWALLWGLASLASEGQRDHTSAISFARLAKKTCSRPRGSWNLYYESDAQLEREVCDALDQLVKTLADN